MENASFSGWAVLELMGHSKEVGFVTTQYFGGPALLRVDQPTIPAGEYTLKSPMWIDDVFAGAGTVIERGEIQGKTVFVGPSAIFRMNPCSEEACKAVIEEGVRRTVKVVTLVGPPKRITSAIDCESDED